MATPVEMPRPGNTVEECLLAKWTKAKGDRVSEGEVIAEIETDKATFEVPAPVGGVLLEMFVREGELAPVFANICVIGAPGESVEEFAPKRQAESQPQANAPVPQRQASVQVERGGGASPRARRFARERGVDLGEVRGGSGPGGRILEQDVRHAFHSGARMSSLERKRVEDSTPFTGIREKIARRMRESLGSTAQYTLNSSADATGLLALRKRIKGAEGPDININDLVLFCTVKALLKMPQLNAELKDGRLRQHDAVHLGFAVDTDRGLMVPVLRDAHRMTIGELAAAAKAVAERAIKENISPDDLSGATFTVSNLGSLGIESFTPILNPPQVAILGVDTIEPRPVRRNGVIEFVDRIGLSLTCDHQVIDGAPGARFLGVVRECIEDVEAQCTI
jgi:pyruvate dehydrogenase E2 component (dihydrolipoamide acetyltransferase)